MQTKSYTEIPNAEKTDIGRIALMEEACNPLAIEDTIEECLATCQACYMTSLDDDGDPRPMTLADCEAIAILITE